MPGMLARIQASRAAASVTDPAMPWARASTPTPKRPTALAVAAGVAERRHQETALVRKARAAPTIKSSAYGCSCIAPSLSHVSAAAYRRAVRMERHFDGVHRTEAAAGEEARRRHGESLTCAVVRLQGEVAAFLC